MAAGYYWPQFSIDSGEPDLILLEVAYARQSPARIHAGHHLVAWDAKEAGARAHFTVCRDGRPCG
ncbi:MAG TPA: hypothetical protein VE690_03095 [Rhodopila sp.]|nr:hypothetical protein [Rhodopila sp.]